MARSWTLIDGGEAVSGDTLRYRIPDGEIVTGVMDNGEIIGLRIHPADTRTCAQRHDEVIAMLSRRVDRLEAELRQMRETMQNWTGE